MSNIRHILRLHTQGVGFFEIIRQTSISRTTLRKHINDFKGSGLSFEDINELSDADLEELFQKPEERPVDIVLQKLLELFPAMDRELKRRGVTRMTLWQEYIKNYPDGYGYSRFNRYFKKWKEQAKPVMHKEHVAGDKMYIKPTKRQYHPLVIYGFYATSRLKTRRISELNPQLSIY